MPGRNFGWSTVYIRLFGRLFFAGLYCAVKLCREQEPTVACIICFDVKPIPGSALLHGNLLDWILMSAFSTTRKQIVPLLELHVVLDLSVKASLQ
jgi:hypothetical protein